MSAFQEAAISTTHIAVVLGWLTSVIGALGAVLYKHFDRLATKDNETSKAMADSNKALADSNRTLGEAVNHIREFMSAWREDRDRLHEKLDTLNKQNGRILKAVGKEVEA